MTRQAEELRLALAMSGGVSLAVWIGGAVAEIDVATRATNTPDGADGSAPNRFWDSLLRVSGHRKVVVDVLSGASAGGLNAVLLGASIATGFDFAEIKDVWLDMGSTEGLVRREPRDVEPLWPSLFKGDEYFLPELHRNLVDLTAKGVAGDERRTIEIRMAATVVEPIRRPAPGAPNEPPLDEPRYRSGFTFRRPYFPFQRDDLDLAERVDSAARQFTLQALALAGRATSSYPVAFEAATVLSTRPTTFNPTPRRPWTPSIPIPDPKDSSKETSPLPVAPDMQGIFCDATHHTAPERPFAVSDGGILDNLPVARSLQAISSAPAEGTTRREVLFLEPSGIRTVAPDHLDPTPTTSFEHRRSTYAVLKGLFGTRVQEETIAEDVAEIEAYNRAVERATAARIARFADFDEVGGIRNRTDLSEAAETSRPVYAIQRSAHDAELVTKLLSDPITVLGGDPFPSLATSGGAVIPDHRWRAPIGHWTSSDRQVVEKLVSATMQQRLQGRTRVLATGALALTRVGELLIEWVRYRQSVDGGSSDLDRAKLQLYRVLAFTRAAIDEPRRLGWVTALVRPDDEWPASLPNTLTDVLTWLDGLARTPRTSREIASWLVAGGEDELVAVIDDCRDALQAPEVNQGPGVLHDAVIDALTMIVDPVIAGVASEHAADTGESMPPGWYLDRVIRDGSETIDEQTLAALEVVCFPEFETGLPCRGPISLHRLSAGNRTPIAPMFVELVTQEGQEATKKLWWDPQNKALALQEGIHVNLKLAGNELAHFSAFLLEKWRKNDWMWGRLDAVPTLVDLLATDDAVEAWLRGIGEPDAWRDEAKKVVVGDPPSGFDLEALVWDAATIVPVTSSSADQAAERMQTTFGSLVEAELAALQGFVPPVGPTNPKPTFPGLRNALIARRQLELLLSELGATPDSLPDVLGRYRIGAETLATSGADLELIERFDEVADAAGNVIVSNAGAALGAPDKVPGWAAAIIKRAASTGGRFFARGVVKPKADKRPRSLVATGAVAAVAAVAATAIVGFALNMWAFLCGIAVTVAPIAALAVAAAWFLKKEPEKPPEDL